MWRVTFVFFFKITCYLDLVYSPNFIWLFLHVPVKSRTLSTSHIRFFFKLRYKKDKNVWGEIAERNNQFIRLWLCKDINCYLNKACIRKTILEFVCFPWNKKNGIMTSEIVHVHVIFSFLRFFVKPNLIQIDSRE